MVSLPFPCNSQTHVSSSKHQSDPLHIEKAYLASLYSHGTRASIFFQNRVAFLFLPKTRLKNREQIWRERVLLFMDELATDNN